EPLETAHTLATGDARPKRHDDAPAMLEVFYELARAMREVGDRDALVERLLAATLGALGCERAVVALGSDGTIVRQLGRGGGRGAGGGDARPDVILGRAMVRGVVLERKSMILRDAARSATLVGQDVLSAMVAPLDSGRGVLGLLYVDDRARADRFAEAHLEF